jgi:hypothetical protein
VWRLLRLSITIIIFFSIGHWLFRVEENDCQILKKVFKNLLILQLVQKNSWVNRCHDSRSKVNLPKDNWSKMPQAKMMFRAAPTQLDRWCDYSPTVQLTDNDNSPTYGNMKTHWRQLTYYDNSPTAINLHMHGQLTDFELTDSYSYIEMS